ncbi:hypothetical protein BTZ20_5559 [Rhodococcus sp. MTM3W5.2]|nr:hypothetical protein BTZ20_5559 [Rhodococcus sp. MTM3W5.2]
MACVEVYASGQALLESAPGDDVCTAIANTTHAAEPCTGRNTSQ